MTQQTQLISELRNMIRTGLKERDVQIREPGWLIDFSDGKTWRIIAKMEPGLVRRITDEQLVVFRDEAEILQVLPLLPDPGPVSTLSDDVDQILDQLVTEVDVLFDEVGVALVQRRDPGEGYRTLERLMPSIKTGLMRIQQLRRF